MHSYRLRFLLTHSAFLPCLLGTALATPAHANAAAEAETPRLPEVTIRSTLRSLSLDQIPASISMLDGEQVRERQWQVNLSESLSASPGLLLQNRQNYAQDLQLTIRGNGARSTFGVRGIRLYVDGIPATMPDGQGQTSNIDLASVDRIEVLRGPYSALYGNASGGVINIYTEQGQGPPTVQSSFAMGSQGQKRLGLKAQGEHKGLGYVVSASRFLTDGWREHSAADRNLGNLRLDLAPDSDSHLTLVANTISSHAKDPLGLSPADWASNPRQAPLAQQFNTRKTIEQTQAGLSYERHISAGHALRFMLYAGERKTTQFQSIPMAPQNAATHSGGVIDLKRRYAGADLRWSSQWQSPIGQIDWITGLAFDTMREDRQGHTNYVLQGGAPVYGQRGVLRRDEKNTIENIDPYTQLSWAFAPRWSVDAGLRWSNVSFDSRDRYIVPGNGDDSGKASYHKLLPVLSLSHQLNAQTTLYSSLGRGFETPTFNEVSYRPDKLGGLNFGLQPSTNTSLEIGLRQRYDRAGVRGDWSAAVFQSQTRDEIVSYASEGGRNSFQNVGKTRRRGLELANTTRLSAQWQLHGALTLLDANVREGYQGSGAYVAAGSRIAGTSKSVAYVGLDWRPGADWRLGLDWRRVGSIAANDSNTVYAPAYQVSSASAAYIRRFGPWKLDVFARIDNLLDKTYVGSVIVNDGNGRFYESAPGRQWMAGVSVAYQF